MVISDDSSLDFGTGDFSVSLWFNTSNGGRLWQKHTNTANEIGMFMDGTRFRLLAEISGSVKVHLQIDEDFRDGNWHHAVVVCDRDSTSNSKIYIDGLSRTLGTNTVDSGANNFDYGDLYLGDRNTSGDGLYTGKLNSIKFFKDVVLSESQVQELYTNPEQILPTGISASNLKLDLPMQEGSDDYVYDGSGNKNDGTISGATWATGEEYGYQASLVRSNTPMIFDGNDFVTIPKLTISGDHTVSAWANIISQGVVVGGSGTSGVDSNAIYPNSNTNIFYKSGSGSFCSIPMNSGVSLIGSGWRHILIVKQTGNDVKAYIDGVFQTSSVTYSGALSDDIDINFIGKRNTGGIINAIINEVAAWNTALDSDAITALYNSGVPLLPTSDSGNYDNSSALQGYWRNDGNITWTDRSTNSNNGTVSSTTVSSIVIPEGTTSGRDNQGFLLSDTHQNSLRLHDSEYVSVQDSEVLSFGDGTDDTPFSLEAWIKMDDAQKFQIFAKGVYFSTTEYIMEVNNDKKLRLNIYDDGEANLQITSYETVLNTGVWIHVCATYDGRGGSSANSGIKLYVNGSSVTVDTSVTHGTYEAMHNEGGDLHIGRNDSDYAKGLIDEPRIYSKELSASEVLKNYNIGKGKHS